MGEEDLSRKKLHAYVSNKRYAELESFIKTHHKKDGSKLSDSDVQRGIVNLAEEKMEELKEKQNKKITDARELDKQIKSVINRDSPIKN